MTEQKPRKKHRDTIVLVVALLIGAAIFASPREHEPEQTKAPAPVETSAAADLRSGDVSIKNGMSAECERQIMAYRTTPECQAQGDRWNNELKSKLSDPAWRERFTRKLQDIYDGGPR
jgi:hypothetical protein